MEKKRFLIIQLYSNGDCLFATTLARQIKTDFPGCHLTWAIAPFCAAILNNNPFVDEIWQIDYVNDRSLETFQKAKPKLFAEAEQKKFDKTFFTQIIEDNFVFYDGQIRSSIFSAFHRSISVPVVPILELTEKEKDNVKHFVSENKLDSGSFVILFECSPQSGQLLMDTNRAYLISQNIITQNPAARIILSSQQSFATDNNFILDGSVLSLRETAYLTNFCDLLIGCSSGITWASTSSAAKPISSVQLLNKKAYFFNSPFLDHTRNNLPTERWLELFEFDNDSLSICVDSIIKEGFEKAKQQFGQKPKQTFKLYRGIVHQFLLRRKFNYLRKFIRRNLKLYGFNLAMVKYIFLGFVLFPFQSILNVIRRKKKKSL